MNPAFLGSIYFICYLRSSDLCGQSFAGSDLNGITFQQHIDYYMIEYEFLCLLLCLALSARFMCLFFGVHRLNVYRGICENLLLNCEDIWCF